MNSGVDSTMGKSPAIPRLFLLQSRASLIHNASKLRLSLRRKSEYNYNLATFMVFEFKQRVDTRSSHQCLDITTISTLLFQRNLLCEIVRDLEDYKEGGRGERAPGESIIHLTAHRVSLN